MLVLCWHSSHCNTKLSLIYDSLTNRANRCRVLSSTKVSMFLHSLSRALVAYNIATTQCFLYYFFTLKLLYVRYLLQKAFQCWMLLCLSWPMAVKWWIPPFPFHNSMVPCGYFRSKRSHHSMLIKSSPQLSVDMPCFYFYFYLVNKSLGRFHTHSYLLKPIKNKISII